MEFQPLFFAMSTEEPKLSVPSGFRNLLESLTVEILRVRPDNIPSFAADFFRERLAARQRNGYDDCLLGSQIDGFYNFEPDRPGNFKDKSKKVKEHGHYEPARAKLNDTADGNNNCGESKKQTTSEDDGERCETAATKIQAGYHGYTCRKKIKHQNEAAMKIQSQYRGYKVRARLVMTEIERQDKDEGDSLSAQEVKAATQIQAHFRGYQTRARLQEGSGESKKAGSDSPKKVSGEQRKAYSVSGEQQKAATAIQAGYRGYRSRKKVKKEVEASTTIQAGFRGYKVRKEAKKREEASTTIQKGYRGYRARRTRSEAAIRIQARYRGYATRKKNKASRPGSAGQTKGLLELKEPEEEVNFPVDREIMDGLMTVGAGENRASFSLPPGDVKFEADLDSDSDTDLDKIVSKIKRSHAAEEDEDQTDNQV